MADRIVQGPQAIFIREADGTGWLPLSSPDGSIPCFQHLGREGEVSLAGLTKASHADKLNEERQSKWFVPDKYGQ